MLASATTSQDADPPAPVGRLVGWVRRHRDDMVLGAAIIALSTVLGFIVLGLPGSFTKLPIAYSGDGITMASAAKSIVENGTYYTNTSMGAPGTAQYFDGPGADGVFILELRLIALFVRNWIVAFNLFCLLSYPLIALSALWAMRRLGLSRGSSFVFAMLYAFLPFHQSRLSTHTLLAMYFSVPVAIALFVEIRRAYADRGAEKPSREFLGLPAWCWLAAALLGLSGIYYAYFTIVLAGAVSVVSAIARRNARPLLSFAGVASIIMLMVVLQMVPSFMYWKRAGSNNLGDKRVAWESDLYALRMTQIVFPMAQHRLPLFAKAKEAYRQQLGAISDKNLGIAYDSSLGLIGAFGFILILLWTLGAPLRAPPDGPDGAPSILSVVGVSAFLLGTVGGIGEIIAFIRFPQIRAYDRITVFVGFASMAAAAWFSDWLIRRVKVLHRDRQLAPSILGLMCFGAVLVLGVWDTTSPALVPPFATIAPAFNSDGAFVRSVESALPPGAAVLQLPYVDFPEAAAINKMGGYDHVRLYLHSKRLRWSAGAYKGRSVAAWQARVAALPAAELVAQANGAGFTGITVDRFGYEDAGRSNEASLSAALGGRMPLTSPDGRYAFFDLR